MPNPPAPLTPEQEEAAADSNRLLGVLAANVLTTLLGEGNATRAQTIAVQALEWKAARERACALRVDPDERAQPFPSDADLVEGFLNSMVRAVIELLVEKSRSDGSEREAKNRIKEILELATTLSAHCAVSDHWQQVGGLRRLDDAMKLIAELAASEGRKAGKPNRAAETILARYRLIEEATKRR
jgi:hypothetical protein